MNLKISSDNQSKELDSMIDDQGATLKMTPILSRKEVCRLLGISLRSEQNYRDQKRISFSQSGRKIFYRPSDIREFLERNHIKACYGQKGVA
jgi:hypothetical protein